MPKAKKNPNAPRRPMSAYLFYASSRRSALKEEQPDLKFGEYGKIIGKEWREMAEDEKKPYVDKAAQDKQRYEKEMSEASK